MGMSFPAQIAFAFGVGALGSLVVDRAHLPQLDLPSFASRADDDHGGCVIKGNISINTGERIYHVPGQMFYDATVISPQYGERWFCSEAEARAAGWRKARR